VAMVEDITVAKGLSEQLSYQATHDALTGLVNRREFETRLRRIIESMEEESEHALCYVDLDQFKLINDTCGHIAGDALLRQLGSMLPSTVRKRDTLARLGGDEFGLLMEHCPLEQAERVANSIRSTIANFRFFWEDKSFNIGASIGLVPISGIEVSVSEVMKAADAACYAAKEGGRNRVQVYRPDDETLRRRSTEMHWATRLTEAIENDHLELFYQPTVALSSSGDGGGDGVFIEVFLRLREADGRLTAPGAFLPSAERYGLASRLDRWVLEHALDWLSKNRGKAGNVEVVSINLSAQTVSDSSFCDALDSILSKYSVPPQSLCFEIAESIAVANLTQTQQFIRDLSAKGVRVALDDFGNGLSSFAYLKSLPVDYLKIDGALVREVLDDKVVHAMVRSISEIGQIMGKEMVAGFVESEAIMDELRMMGIDRAQGFAVQHPQPLPDTFTTDTLQII
jgi:diguanylate cyclase (GGDEF)-like protein